MAPQRGRGRLCPQEVHGLQWTTCSTIISCQWLSIKEGKSATWEAFPRPQAHHSSPRWLLCPRGWGWEADEAFTGKTSQELGCSPLPQLQCLQAVCGKIHIPGLGRMGWWEVRTLACVVSGFIHLPTEVGYPNPCRWDSLGSVARTH